MPHLSAIEQNELAVRISAIKTASKTHAINNNLYFTGLQLFKAGVGFVGGPIGGAVATFYTHDVARNLKKENLCIVKKAKMVGGRRVAGHLKKERQASTSAIQEAVKSGIKGAAIAASNVKDIAFTGMEWGFTLGKAIFYGR